MKTVKFANENRTQVIATGFDNKEQAESAIDSFLAEQGSEYGRSFLLEAEYNESGLKVFVAPVSVA